jgi:hypothetical protein
MVNSTATASAGPAAPTPEQIKRYLVRIPFYERVWNVVRGIFSEDPLKTRWGIKYAIKDDFIKFRELGQTEECLAAISKLGQFIRRSDLTMYMNSNWAPQMQFFKKTGLWI